MDNTQTTPTQNRNQQAIEAQLPDHDGLRLPCQWPNSKVGQTEPEDGVNSLEGGDLPTVFA